MKKTILFAFLLTIGLQSFSQVSSTEQELIKSYFKLTKMALVEDAMALSEEDGALFWPLYKQFDAEASKLNQLRIDYLSDYVAQVENITNEQVDEFLKNSNSYNKKMVSLKSRYYKLMKKELSSKVAIRFMLVEEYIQTAVKYELLETLPWVGDY
ncbi:MAG: hypothetical protein U9R60_07935 [Bacteroidota bacterium]|nr:hypothetical protein [Bacteroidota bacterium]